MASQSGCASRVSALHRARRHTASDHHPLLKEMGKAATYRKRGTSRAGQGQSILPPAPLAVVDGEYIAFQATGLDDTGGWAKAYTSATPTGPWDIQASAPWGPFLDLLAIADVRPCYAYTNETGNGSTYVGESAPSNILHLP
jgi:hypothetical protein